MLMNITNKSKNISIEVFNAKELSLVLLMNLDNRLKLKKEFKRLTYVEMFWSQIQNIPHLSLYRLNVEYSKFLHELGFKKYGSSRSIDYWLVKGYTEQEALDEIKCLQKEYSNKHTTNTRRNPRQLKFWLDKGFDIQQAKEKISQSQSRGKEFYKKKGFNDDEIETIKKLRNEKWLSSLQKKLLNDNFNLRKGRTVSQLVEKFGEEKAKSIIAARHTVFCGQSKAEKVIFEKYFKPNGFIQQFYLFNPENNRYFLYDYCNEDKKILIEFNGNYWYCNPLFFDADYIHPTLHKTAREIWAKDERKKNLARACGFELAVLWEAANIEEQIKQLCNTSTTLKSLLENSLNS